MHELSGVMSLFSLFFFLMLTQFCYADGVDVLLMIVGLVAAAANGTGMPLLIIFFGEMTNSFVLSGMQPNGKKFKLNFSTYWLCFATETEIPFFSPDYTLVHI